MYSKKEMHQKFLQKHDKFLFHETSEIWAHFAFRQIGKNIKNTTLGTLHTYRVMSKNPRICVCVLHGARSQTAGGRLFHI